MSKLTAALTAVVFVTGTLAGTPAWADRWNQHHDRGHFTKRFPVASHREHREHRDRGDGRWIAGLGLLAGTAMLLAATEPRTVTYAAPVPVYAPPAPVYAAPPNQWWYYCTQPAGYFPYVQQCSTGWRRIAPQPPM